jgi:hypothetical protein
MKVLIENQGDTAIHIITDRDTVSELVLEAGEAETFDAEIIIEVREADAKDESGPEPEHR